MHLDEGQAPDGTQLLSPAAVKQMQQTQIEVPDKYTLGDRWGLGWILFDWDGHPGFGHDGSTLGQYAFMRVLPESRLAVALLTNGGQASQVYKTLVREVFSDLAGVTVPAVPGVPDTPPDLDLGLYEGTYARLNVELTLTVKEEGNSLDAVVVASGPIAEMIPEAQRRQTLDIVPVDRELFLASDDKSPAPTPMVFFDFDGDRPGRLHFGARAMTRR
jgi:hypothetical protein